MTRDYNWKTAYFDLKKEYDTVCKENDRLKSKPKREFSKTIMTAVMFTYFVGLFFGMYAVSKILTDYPEWAIQALISMFGYIAAPVGVAIGFYSWKAKNDNGVKIPLLIASEQNDVDTTV